MPSLLASLLSSLARLCRLYCAPGDSLVGEGISAAPRCGAVGWEVADPDMMSDWRLVGRNYHNRDRIDKIDLNGEKIIAQLRGWPWRPAIR